MRRYTLILLALALLMPVGADAQRRKSKKTTVKKPVVVEDPRIQQMLVSTQKVIFIDSMVVSKADFMRYIPLSADAGLLEQNDSLGQFTNELKDHRLTTFFDKADSACHIAQSDYIGNTWTAPIRVEGISDYAANFPFLMPDGTTLYFAQKGENSIGGYDLFVTRYDSDTGSFLRAENLGMPFSSTANDYLYAIDEANNLGYFVTDRRQPQGQVCIYVFIPNETRKIYTSEAYSDEQLRKEPWFQDFSFAYRKFNAACHYIPQKNLVVFYERIYSASRRKKFLETVEGLKKELRGNGFKFKYESNAIKNTLFWGNGNLRFMPFHNVPPTRGSRYQVENYQ